MQEFKVPDDTVVLTASVESFCEDGLAEFQPVIRLTGKFPKAFGENFLNAISYRFTEFLFVIDSEIKSYSSSSAPADDK